MNERLFELIQSQNGLCGLLWSEEDKQEFAELIVRECVDVVAGVMPGYKDYRSQIEEAMRDDCVAAVKQHFGVEE